MDKDANCCEEARVSIVEWFEEHIDKVDKPSQTRFQPDTRKSFKESLIVTSQSLSEADCDELYEDITNFMENYDLEKSEFWDYQSLKDIMDNWDKCKEEPKGSAQDVFDTNPVSWMNNYIRG